MDTLRGKIVKRHTAAFHSLGLAKNLHDLLF
jgi:hypothetical protein